MFDHKGYTEKSLARLIKAKHKAERAAARQAAAVVTVSAPATTNAPIALARPTSPLLMVDEGQVESSPTAEKLSQDDAVTTASKVGTAKEPANDRIELLRSRPVVVDRFTQLMVPILIDVYAASVITPVRIKTLTGLLKAVSFLEADGLRRALTVRIFSLCYNIVPQ